jgi:hypothetical protein
MEDAQRVVCLATLVRICLSCPDKPADLLLSPHRAILTLFQIPDAADDPLTRTAALCSLVSALMSLAYGIMYIIQFGNMRSMYRASRWAEVNILSLVWLAVFLTAISLICLSLSNRI